MLARRRLLLGLQQVMCWPFPKQRHDDPEWAQPQGESLSLHHHVAAWGGPPTTVVSASALGKLSMLKIENLEKAEFFERRSRNRKSARNTKSRD